MTKKSVISIYATAVCFVCVAAATIAATTLFYNVIEIYNPAFTMNSYDYAHHQNNRSFREYKLMNYPREHANPYQAMTEDELTAARERSFETMLERERRNGRQALLRSLIVIAVLAVTFWGHWTIMRRTSNDAPETK